MARGGEEELEEDFNFVGSDDLRDFSAPELAWQERASNPNSAQKLAQVFRQRVMLAPLGQAESRALEMRATEGKTLQEVAEETGLSLREASLLYHRGLNVLRQDPRIKWEMMPGAPDTEFIEREEERRKEPAQALREILQELNSSDLEQRIKDFSPRRREVVKSIVGIGREPMGISQCAEKLGISESSVKIHLSRAHREAGFWQNRSS